MTPMPSGSRRMSSSVGPGRIVGLIKPTMPCLLENAISVARSLIAARADYGQGLEAPLA